MNSTTGTASTRESTNTPKKDSHKGSSPVVQPLIPSQEKATADKHIQTARPSQKKNTQTSKGILNNTKNKVVPATSPLSPSQERTSFQSRPSGSAPGTSAEAADLDATPTSKRKQRKSGSEGARMRNNARFVQQQQKQRNVSAPNNANPTPRGIKPSLNPNKKGHHRDRMRQVSQTPNPVLMKKAHAKKSVYSQSPLSPKSPPTAHAHVTKHKSDTPAPERESDLDESEEDDFDDDYSETEIAFDDAEGFVIEVPSGFIPIKPFPKSWTDPNNRPRQLSAEEIELLEKEEEMCCWCFRK